LSLRRIGGALMGFSKIILRRCRFYRLNFKRAAAAAAA
jgi:hypothetical protein